MHLFGLCRGKMNQVRVWHDATLQCKHKTEIVQTRRIGLQVSACAKVVWCLAVFVWLLLGWKENPAPFWITSNTSALNGNDLASASSNSQSGSPFLINIHDSSSASRAVSRDIQVDVGTILIISLCDIEMGAKSKRLSEKNSPRTLLQLVG